MCKISHYLLQKVDICNELQKLGVNNLNLREFFDNFKLDRQLYEISNACAGWLCLRGHEETIFWRLCR